MRNPILWVASNKTLQINRRKVTSTDRRWPMATFHDTWEEAHAAQVAKAQGRLEKAGKEARRAVRSALSAAKLLDKVEAMKNPEIAMTTPSPTDKRKP